MRSCRCSSVPTISRDDGAARRIRPERRANPHKIFPDAKVCVEARAPRRQAPL
jgi:hypothetical protein